MNNTKEETISKCQRCTRCCRYFCVEVDAPDTMEEIDGYVWILAHEGVSIHVEDDEWFLYVQTPCKYLDKDGSCKIYDSRPNICKEHVPGECEFQSDSIDDYDDSDIVFTDIEQLRRWAEENITEEEDQDENSDEDSDDE